MKSTAALSKRPCRICRRWFAPDPRLKDRQKTCGDAACMREWHRRKCKQWNKDNSAYFKANLLHHKLEASKSQVEDHECGHHQQDRPRAADGHRRILPAEVVQEVMGAQACVIIEYLAQQLLHCVQEVIRRQVPVNTS